MNQLLFVLSAVAIVANTIIAQPLRGGGHCRGVGVNAGVLFLEGKENRSGAINDRRKAMRAVIETRINRGC